jgi:ribosomal protein L9
MVIEVQVKDGAITETLDAAAIAGMLKRAAAVTVEAEDVVMPEVTELGSVVATLKLHPEVSTSLKIVVEKSKITFS